MNTKKIKEDPIVSVGEHVFNPVGGKGAEVVSSYAAESYHKEYPEQKQGEYRYKRIKVAVPDWIKDQKSTRFSDEVTNDYNSFIESYQNYAKAYENGFKNYKTEDDAKVAAIGSSIAAGALRQKGQKLLDYSKMYPNLFTVPDELKDSYKSGSDYINSLVTNSLDTVDRMDKSYDKMPEYVRYRNTKEQNKKYAEADIDTLRQELEELNNAKQVHPEDAATYEFKISNKARFRKNAVAYQNAVRASEEQKAEQDRMANFDYDAAIAQREKERSDYKEATVLENNSVGSNPSIDIFRERQKKYLHGYDSYEDFSEAYLSREKDILNYERDKTIRDAEQLRASEDYAAVVAEAKAELEKNVGNAFVAVFGSTTQKVAYNHALRADNSRLDEAAERANYLRSGGTDEDAGKAGFYMTEPEYNLYLYMSKTDPDRAEKYLEALNEQLDVRYATDIADATEGNTLNELATLFYFAAEQNIADLKIGLTHMVGDAFDNDYYDYIPQSYRTVTHGLIDQDLGEGNEAMFGKTWGQIFGDLAWNTGNMLPSILASNVANLVLPGSGEFVGSAMMGVSAASQSYQEAVNAGYTKDAARAYGTAIGLTETVFERVLGGITPFSGHHGMSGIAERLASKLAQNVDKSILIFCVRNTVSATGEFFEEYLEEWLEPQLKKAILGDDSDVISFFSTEALYAGLLGFASGAILDAPGTALSVHEKTKAGRKIKSSGSVESLVDAGKTFSMDSVAYKLADKVNEKTSAYTLGTLFQEVSANMSEQNRSDIVNGLEELGYAPKNAEQVADAFSSYINGDMDGGIKTAIEMSNDPLRYVIADKILSPNSTAYQRIAAFNESATRMTADPATADTVILQRDSLLESARKVVTENQNRMKNLQRVGNAYGESKAVLKELKLGKSEKYRYSAPDNGRTENLRTVHTDSGETAKITDVSIKDGNAELTLENGETVPASSVTFDSRNDAMLLHALTAADMDGMSAKLLFMNYDGGSVVNYAVGVREGYNNGKLGNSRSASYFIDKWGMNPRQYTYAYKLGEINSNRADSQRTRDVKRAAKKDGSRKNVDSKLEISRSAEIAAERMTRDEKAHYEKQRGYGELASELFPGLKIVLHASEKTTENGQTVYRDMATHEVLENGWYDSSDGSLHLDINSGIDGDGIMAFTLSHELVHHIKVVSSTQFRELAKLLSDIYYLEGGSLESMAKARAKRDGIDFSVAFEESVAHSLERMLLDSDALEYLIRLRKKSGGLFKRMRGQVDEAYERAKQLRDEFENRSPESVEGRVLERGKDEMYVSSIDTYERAKAGYEEAYEAYRTAEPSEQKERIVAVSEARKTLRLAEKRLAAAQRNAAEIAKLFKRLHKLFAKAAYEASVTYEAAKSSDKAWGEFKNGTQDAGNKRYALREGAKDDIKKALTDTSYREDVYLTEKSPSIMISQSGVKDLPMMMKASHIRENVLTAAEARKMNLPVNEHTHYHGLGEQLFTDIIDGLEDVTLAYRGTKEAKNSARRENYFLLISQYKNQDGDTVIVPVFINGKGQYNNVFIDINKVATAFGKENFREYIRRELERGNLVRIKNRSTQASERTGLIPGGYSSNASDGIITQAGSESQPLSDKNSKKYQRRENIGELLFDDQKREGQSAQKELTAEFKNTVDGILSGAKNVRDSVVMGYTPNLYRDLGMPSLPFVIGAGHIYSIAKTEAEAKAEGKFRDKVHYHGLGQTAVENIYEKLLDPIAIISAKDVDKNKTPMRSTHSVVAIVDIGTEGKQLLMPVEITAERIVNGERYDVNVLSSTYKRNSLELLREAVALENVGDVGFYYAKKEASDLLIGAGVQFPKQLQAAIASDGIIRNFGAKVNMNVSNVTNSLQFKRWFGDWQNRPERASKVVNADGSPKIVYHGTSDSFNIFDLEKSGKNFGDLSGGFFFFTNYRDGYPNSAMDYARNSSEKNGGEAVVAEAYLNIKKPLYLDSRGYYSTSEYFDRNRESIGEKYLNGSYDGIIIENSDKAADDGILYAVNDPTQIKSATDNIGTFDGKNPDIRYQKREKSETALRAETAEAVLRDKYNVNVAKLLTDMDVTVENYDGSKTKQELRADILEAAARTAEFTSGEGSFKSMQDAVQGLADEIVYNSPVLYNEVADDLTVQAQREIKKTRFKVSDKVKADFESAKDYESFRRNHIGRLPIASDGTAVDVAYMELNERFGKSLFPSDITNPADQLRQIAEITDRKSETATETELTEIRDAMSASLFRAFSEPAQAEKLSTRERLVTALETQLNTSTEHDVLSRYRSKLGETAKHEQNIAELESRIEQAKQDGKKPVELKPLYTELAQEKNRLATIDSQLLRIEMSKPIRDAAELARERQLKRVKARMNAKQRERLADAKSRYEEKLREQKAEDRARLSDTIRRKNKQLEDERRARTLKEQEKRQSRNATEYRHRIIKRYNELKRLLLRGTKEHHIPNEVKATVARLLESFDILNASRDSRIPKVRERIADTQRKLDAAMARLDGETDATAAAKLREAIARYEGEIEHDGEIIDGYVEQTGRAADLAKLLGEIYDGYKADEDSYYAPEVAEKLEQLSKNLKDKPLRDMTLVELTELDNLFGAVKKLVTERNRIFVDGRRQMISEAADGVMREIRENAPKKETKETSGSVGGRKTVNAADALRSLDANNLKPVYLIRRLRSGIMSSLFNEVRNGEDVYAVDITAAKDYRESTAEKYHYDEGWRNKTIDKVFRSSTGKEFRLTVEEAMALYAYTKRSDAVAHLRDGGFQFEKKVGAATTVTDLSSYKVDERLATEIRDSLSEEQRGFADEMQKYLAQDCAAQGNEVSLALYGYLAFGQDPNYFPMQSVRDFVAKGGKDVGDPKAKNKGFTNPTIPGANNPLVLRSFSDVWASHVNDMAIYHALVIPLENFERVWRYHTPFASETEVSSVKTAVTEAYGPAIANAVEQLITDINGGVRQGIEPSLSGRFFSRFKKGAVLGSISVGIQQPSAVGRAFAYIDIKHFLNLKHFVPKIRRKIWTEVKKYAPVAIIKEMGYFDTGIGRSVEEYINAPSYDGFVEKAKAFVVDEAYRDEQLGHFPQVMDELTWCHIWEATKNMVREEQGLTGEALLEEAGRRYTDVIIKTQVYDSVMSRSAFMRSQSGLAKMATAFAAEPTTTINMLEDGAIQFMHGGKEGKRFFGRVVASCITATIINSALKSIVYAARDDDDDQSYLEKYIEAFFDSLTGDLNLLTYFPVLRDIWSLVEGYDVERADMTLFADFVDATKRILEADEIGYRDIEDFAGSVANFFGLPVKNVMRDIRSAYQAVGTIFSDNKTTAHGIADSIESAIPFHSENPKRDLYNALKKGDSALADELMADITRGKELQPSTVIRQALRENDDRIRDAAQLRYDGDIDGYAQLVRAVQADGFDLNDVINAVNSELRKIESEHSEQTDESSEKTDSATSDGASTVQLYSKADIIRAYGDTDRTVKIVEELQKSLTDGGKTKKEARAQVRARVSAAYFEIYREKYLDGSIGSAKYEIRDALRETHLYDSIADLFAGWNKRIMREQKSKK